jgi:hypothetical protein
MREFIDILAQIHAYYPPTYILVLYAIALRTRMYGVYVIQAKKGHTRVSQKCRPWFRGVNS